MYEYRVMFFDFAKTSTTFQTYINVAFREYLDVFVFTYINDIFIFFKILKKHVQHMCVVFKRFLQYKLYVNIKKSKFNVIKTNFLRFIINRENVEMNLIKIKTVTN